MTHSVLYLLIYALLGKLNTEAHSSTISISFVIITSYLVLAVSWYILVKKTPGRWPARRYMSLVADLSVVTASFHILGQNAAVAYPLYLWVMIGNGIRFGERYLIVGVVLGATGFSSVLLYAPFWRDNVELSSGLLAGVVILPLFFLGVLKRLKGVHQLEVELNKSRLADQAKDEFLATMSHELRTPMNGVLGMAETLRDATWEPEKKEQLHIITRSVESLLNTITDILDYSKISSLNLDLDEKPFDLRQTLTDVRLLMDSAAHEKGLVLNFDYPDDQPQYFHGDSTRICQIIFNLIGNAIKFTHQGHVTLRCRVHEDHDKARIILEVEDTGIGIPADRLGAIFGHFEQVDSSTTRRYEGAGLGLSISRKLAQMMGGNVEVTSRLGLGSVFTISLLLGFESEPVPEGNKRRKNWPQFGYHALVVEDNKFNQVVVLSLLKKIGISCRVAEDGRQAVEMIDREHYDLVFMDIRMPIMNGYEATEKIRARTDQLADIPILALTGEATSSDVAKCLAAGMNLHMSKPVRLATLVESVQSLELGSPVGDHAYLPTLTVPATTCSQPEI